jgi:hypothetical protein
MALDMDNAGRGLIPTGYGCHPESRSDERIAVHPRLFLPWRESDPCTIEKNKTG